MAGETITRRNLPHWFIPEAAHFVTFRIAGTIPVALLLRWREERTVQLHQPPPAGKTANQWKEIVHKQFFARYDEYLDGLQDATLTQAPVASVVRSALYFHNPTRYQLLSYCIMPNHVHVLLQAMDQVTEARPEDYLPDELPDRRSPLSNIMHSIKSYTANEINKILGRSGQFWQHESYDHWVRDANELENIVHYIDWNPVKSRLVKQPHEWFFGSAHDRFLRDGATIGWLGS